MRSYLSPSERDFQKKGQLSEGFSLILGDQLDAELDSLIAQNLISKVETLCEDIINAKDIQTAIMAMDIIILKIRILLQEAHNGDQCRINHDCYRLIKIPQKLCWALFIKT